MREPLFDVALDALREGFALFEGDALTLAKANLDGCQIFAVYAED